MSYAALLDSNLAKAFNIMKDLAEDVVFTKTSGVSFNFASSEVAAARPVSISVKAVLVKSKKANQKSNTLESSLLVKAKDVGDITLYDTVTINSEVWKIGPNQQGGKYTLLLEIYKEK